MNTLDLSRPVQTRDGRSVHLLTTEGRGDWKFVGYIGEEQGVETWRLSGHTLTQGGKSIRDLVNVPVWTLSRHLPGFRALRDGEEWHTVANWEEEMLPPGYRPLLLGEKPSSLDEGDRYELGWQVGFVAGVPLTTDKMWCLHRTTRPLPPIKKRVPLGPEDVPPGSCLRIADDQNWFILGHERRGVITGSFSGTVLRRWEELMTSGDLIKRPGEDWQPASKETTEE